MSAETGGREGVVNDERNAGGVGDAGEAFDVEHHQRRIGERLGEDHLGVRPDRGGDGGGVVVGTDETHLNAHLVEGVGQQRNASAVEARHREDVIPR